MQGVITVSNNDSKKYFVYSEQKRFCLSMGATQSFEGEILIVRAFSRRPALDIIIKGLLFLLCSLFVFFDTDFENGEMWMVMVKYRCRAISSDLSLTVQRTQLFNVSKRGKLQAEFSINKLFLIAHIISVFLYSFAVLFLFLFLGINTAGESALSPLFFVLAALSAGGAGYMIYYTFKKLFKTLDVLREHYKDYSY